MSRTPLRSAKRPSKRRKPAAVWPPLKPAVVVPAATTPEVLALFVENLSIIQNWYRESWCRADCPSLHYTLKIAVSDVKDALTSAIAGQRYVPVCQPPLA